MSRIPVTAFLAVVTLALLLTGLCPSTETNPFKEFSTPGKCSFVISEEGANRSFQLLSDIQVFHLGNEVFLSGRTPSESEYPRLSKAAPVHDHNSCMLLSLSEVKPLALTE